VAEEAQRKRLMRLLFAGWDAADWKVIDPLLARGEMPHLAALLAQGVRGNSSTIYPPLSPMVWTSIATGKRPTKHGIHGFIEPTEDGLAVRPVSNLGRKTKAFWNILCQRGKTCIVVGWWPSHPAEPIRGAMVSDHFPLTAADKPDRPLAPGIVSPPALAGRLSELRVHRSELTGDILRLFVPDWQKVDQEKDKSLHDLAGIIAETMSIHAAATDLMETEPWDVAAVYFSGIDHFSHRFMRYHARKRGRVGATDPTLFRDIVVNAYRYHDLMLGRLMQLAGPDAAVMVASDHGFHSDSMLPDYIPAEAAGPAVEHRDFGIFCLKGGGIRQGETIHGVSVLDIAPTILHLFGLPAGADMDGKVLINAFDDRTLPPRIPSWDGAPGNDGRHPPERQYDATSSVESLRQLVDLGYVNPPAGDNAKVVADCVAESRYNLARAYMDAGDFDQAAELLQRIIADDAEQIRYHQHLFHCRLAQRRYEECEQLLDTLDATYGQAVSRGAEAPPH
jgi:FimV-like protein